ncbi:MAG: M3 family oligoendopeptidase [bacterium]|nr:M3 family oligoendopeptidase [bacterium]
MAGSSEIEGEKLEPNWDLTPFFPEFDGVEYRSFRDELAASIEGAQARVARLGDLRLSNVSEWVELLVLTEDIGARTSHIGSYIGCMAAADSLDEAVQRQSADLSNMRAELQKLSVGIRAALDDCDDATFAELLADARLRDASYFVERLRERARWSMSTELEQLSADLGVNGLSAWGRLYSQVTGKLEFDFEIPGKASRRLPVAIARSLMEDPDPQTRTAAFRGANAAWEGVSDVMAACLNAIAGTRLSLYERRGVSHFLDPALFDAGISRTTLDTLMDVVRARADVARRYLKRKARILGQESLGFQDLMAPLPLGDAGSIPWDEACIGVQRAFEGYSEDLGGLSARAFERRWIDYESRPGKRPGGFCSTSPLLGESRVFMTYNGALGDLRTLAHELGHAYHGWLMRDMRPWARRYPMTLAETASTFAEQVYTESVLADPGTSEAQRCVILDSRLAFAAVFLVNIPVRFEFEKAFYEERASGEVSVTRLCELMIEAQRCCYGESLDENQLNPWMWASTLHFYITELSFYNFPYTFGFLFSLGLFGRAQAEGKAFLEQYDELLRLTGSDDAEDVARRCMGVDLEAPEFWNSSIDGIETDLERFLAESEKLFS